MLVQYFTIWCLLNYLTLCIISRINTLPAYMIHSATALIITCSILGSPMLLFNMEKFKFPNIIILIDIIVHWFPLFLSLKYFNRTSQSFSSITNFNLAILYGFLFYLIYIRFFNPEKVYSFAQINNKNIFLKGTVIYLISLYLLKIKKLI
ncbi:hypothetical protein CPAV1605_150 [seawater metagenome]|uniref:Uncharacterized protein n=1 Tax=seawater metagenome TaxID=1561972 RepID=A0A5E8CG90_9ZZZZ